MSKHDYGDGNDDNSVIWVLLAVIGIAICTLLVLMVVNKLT